VFLYFGQGYPTFKTLALWKVDTARPQIVVKADRNEHANVAAAPDGRFWLMWEVNGTIFATRTNRTATRAGAVNALKAPGSRTVYRLNGDGSAGPLDLIVNDGQGLWHQQVWPKLQLTASRSGRNVVFRVVDAGDPVAGATVKAGGRSLRTAANGRATLQQASAGRVKATATKAGYAPGSASVR
jgi:hypothetical protein